MNFIACVILTVFEDGCGCSNVGHGVRFFPFVAALVWIIEGIFAIINLHVYIVSLHVEGHGVSLDNRESSLSWLIEGQITKVILYIS